MAAPRLTSLSHGAGCACKLGMDVVDRITRGVATAGAGLDLDLLVGPGDDAAVWRVGDRQMVATTDFFTPIVDDARTWGAIAATNAGSDVFAMGGTPTVALNIVGWPAQRDLDELREVMAGAADAAASGGWLTVGGHSIDSTEPFFGQVVIGELDGEPFRQDAGRPGDVLVLTAPLGTGIVVTAAKRSPRAAVHEGGALHAPYRHAIEIMTTHNRAAAAAARVSAVRCATDVTGFGLLGHLHRLADASGVVAELEPDRVPVVGGIDRLVDGGYVPGGTRRNLATLRQRGVLDGDADVLDTQLLVLADAQTSGGLLLACPAGDVDGLCDRLEQAGQGAAIVGRLADGPAGHIRLR